MTRDEQITAEIEEALVTVSRVGTLVGSAVAHAQQNEALDHAEIYEAARWVLSEAEAAIEKALQIFRDGDPAEGLSVADYLA